MLHRGVRQLYRECSDLTISFNARRYRAATRRASSQNGKTAMREIPLLFPFPISLVSLPLHLLLSCLLPPPLMIRPPSSLPLPFPAAMHSQIQLRCLGSAVSIQAWSGRIPSCQRISVTL